LCAARFSFGFRAGEPAAAGELGLDALDDRVATRSCAGNTRPTSRPPTRTRCSSRSRVDHCAVQAETLTGAADAALMIIAASVLSPVTRGSSEARIRSDAKRAR